MRPRQRSDAGTPHLHTDKPTSTLAGLLSARRPSAVPRVPQATLPGNRHTGGSDRRGTYAPGSSSCSSSFPSSQEISSICYGSASAERQRRDTHHLTLSLLSMREEQFVFVCHRRRRN